MTEQMNKISEEFVSAELERLHVSFRADLLSYNEFVLMYASILRLLPLPDGWEMKFYLLD